MAKTIKNSRQLKGCGSSQPLNQQKFNKVLQDLIENPTIENLDRINHIRLWFLHSTKVTEYICRQMQGLTRKLRTPDEEDLRVLHAMLSSCRQLSNSSKLLANDYEILCSEGFIMSEIDDFRKAYSHLQEMIYYLESVYLSLPDGLVVNDLARRN